MNKNQKIFSGAIITIVVVGVLWIGANPISTPQNDVTSPFPDFITANEDYFVTRIGSVPDINRDTYRLEIHGLIDTPRNFTFVELQSLTLTNLTLTIECIGNRRE